MATMESRGNMKGVIIAGAVGAALALLFAPKSGREFRKDLKNAALDMQSKGVDLLGQAKIKSSDTLRMMSEQGSKLLNKAYNTAEGAAQTAREKTDTLAESVHRATDKLADSSHKATDAFKESTHNKIDDAKTLNPVGGKM